MGRTPENPKKTVQCNMYTEALDPPLGVRFLYKLRSNTTYIESQNTLNDGVDQNYKENERATKPIGLYIHKKTITRIHEKAER